MIEAPLTFGVDHVGLSVSNLNASAGFFSECLGWKVVGENPAYPAIFVSDGRTRVTLWRVEDPESCGPFDRRQNVGLHHLAFKVADVDSLKALHQRTADWPGVVIELAPQLSGKGPKIHSMIREPSGNRIEFSFDP